MTIINAYEGSVVNVYMTVEVELLDPTNEQRKEDLSSALSGNKPNTESTT